MVNVGLLKGKIRCAGMSVNDVAAQIGMNPATFYRKIAADGEKFTVGEVVEISQVLDLSIDDVNSIFFKELSHNCEKQKGERTC